MVNVWTKQEWASGLVGVVARCDQRVGTCPGQVKSWVNRGRAEESATCQGIKWGETMKKSVVWSAVMAMVATLLGGMMLTSAVMAPPAQADTIDHPADLVVSTEATPAVPAPMPEPLAPSVDLRQWAVPAGYQGSVGACSAWTVGYSLMGWYANKNGVAAQAFAPMSIFSQAMAASMFGNNFDDMFQLATSKGVDTQDDYMPQGSFDALTLPTAAQQANAAKYRLTGYQKLFSTGSLSIGGGVSGQTMIQAALAQGTPVAIGLQARMLFTNWMTHTDLNDIYNDLTSPVVGGHAVLAVGYDANGLLIENSFGTTWGVNGYARLSWAVVQQDVSEAYVANGLNPVAASPVVKVAGSSGMPQSVWTAASTGSGENIMVPANTSWTVTSAPSWVTVSPAGGFGLVLPGKPGQTGLVNVQATANMTGAFRTGAVTFSAKSGGLSSSASLTVNQYSATGSSVTPTMTLSQSSWNAPVTTGSLPVSVFSNSSWMASSSDSWVTMFPDTGYGNGSVSLMVEPNTSTDARSATVTFTSTWGSPAATAKVAIFQRGMVTANLSLSTLSWPVSSSGGSTQVSVSSNQSWSVSGSATWLGVSSMSGTGDKTLTLTASPNPTASTRWVNLVFTTTSGDTKASMTLGVNQAGAPQALSLSQATWIAPVAGGPKPIAVSSNTSWSVWVGATWVTPSSTSGSGNDTLTLNASPNTDSLPRYTTVQVRTSMSPMVIQTVMVYQSGTADPKLSILQSTWDPSSDGGSIWMSVSSTVVWTVASDSTWVSLSADVGSGSGGVTLKADPNPAASSRSATVTFTTSSSVGVPVTKTVQVTQAAGSSPAVVPSLSVSKTVLPFTAVAGSLPVDVSSNTSWTVVASNSSWVTVPSGTMSGDKSVSVSVSANPSTSPRSAVVTFSTLSSVGVPVTRSVSVTQGAAAPQMTLSTSALSFTAAAGSQPVVVSLNTAVTVSADASWVSFSIPQGSLTVNVQVAANTSVTARSATVTFVTTVGSPQVTRTVKVTQNGAAPQMTLSASALSFTAAAGSQPVVVSLNTAATVSADASWVTFSIPQGSLTVNVQVSANTSAAARSATVTFVTTAGSPQVTRTVKVTQDGFAPAQSPSASGQLSLKVSPSPVTIPAAGGTVNLQVSSNTSWAVTYYCNGSFWLSASGTQGTGNGTVVLTAPRNLGTQPLTAVMTFTAGSGTSAVTQTVNVTQPPVGS